MVNETVREKTSGTEGLDAGLSGELVISRDELINEILSRMTRREIPPNAFTRRQFMEQSGMKQSSARTVLDREVETGRLQTDIAVVGGYRQRIWWRDEKKTEEEND